MQRAMGRNLWVALSWSLSATLCLACLSGCSRMRLGPSQPSADSAWVLKDRRRLAANELWKEYNGGDQVYIEHGCVSATLLDYRHRSRPWAIRCSVFDQSTPKGARALFDYYYEGIENEVRGIEPIGKATYMWKSPVMRSWIVGFCERKFFVEISLTEEGDSDVPLTDAARRALLDFAEHLAATL